MRLTGSHSSVAPAELYISFRDMEPALPVLIIAFRKSALREEKNFLNFKFFKFFKFLNLNWTQGYELVETYKQKHQTSLLDSKINFPVYQIAALSQISSKDPQSDSFSSCSVFGASLRGTVVSHGICISSPNLKKQTVGVAVFKKTKQKKNKP